MYIMETKTAQYGHAEICRSGGYGRLAALYIELDSNAAMTPQKHSQTKGRRSLILHSSYSIALNGGNRSLYYEISLLGRCCSLVAGASDSVAFLLPERQGILNCDA